MNGPRALLGQLLEDGRQVLPSQQQLRAFIVGAQEAGVEFEDSPLLLRQVHGQHEVPHLVSTQRQRTQLSDQLSLAKLPVAQVEEAHALFRSAAYAYGPGVIAVVLSGMLDDGVSGLWAVKRRSGVAVVQKPGDALFGEMPRNALKQVDVDHVVPLSEMAALLTRLAQSPVHGKGEDQISDQEHERLAAEVQVTTGQRLPLSEWMRLGEPSTLTCPECHGALLKVREGALARYRCHTGHAFSESSLLAYVTGSIEDSLWNAMRAIDESQMLLRHMAEHYAEVGDTQTAETFLDRAEEAQDRASQIRALVVQRRVQEPARSRAVGLTPEDTRLG